MNAIAYPVAPLAAAIRDALAVIPAQPQVQAQPAVVEQSAVAAAQAADAASITQLATDFVGVHASEIAAAERAHQQPPGSLVGASYEAAYDILAAGGDPTVRRVIGRAVYSVSGSIAEPVSRPHRGHTYAVRYDDATSAMLDDLDPLTEITRWETVREMEQRSAYARRALREAAENDTTPASNYRGRDVAQRTAERRRASARVAQEFGQLGFDGFGWGVA